MASVITISDEAKARAEKLVQRGDFDSVEQVMETALEHLAYGYESRTEAGEIDPDTEADALIDVSSEDRDAIRHGLRDAKEGRTVPLEHVRTEMRQRFGSPRN